MGPKTIGSQGITHGWINGKIGLTAGNHIDNARTHHRTQHLGHNVGQQFAAGEAPRRPQTKGYRRV